MSRFKFNKNKPILSDGTIVEDFEIFYEFVDLTWNAVSPSDGVSIFAGAKLNGKDISEVRAKEVVEVLKKL